MLNQFEHDEIGKVPFRNLLNAAMPIIKSKPLIMFSIDKEVAYIGVTGYLYSCADVQEPATAGIKKATPSGAFDRTLCARSGAWGEVVSKPWI